MTIDEIRRYINQIAFSGVMDFVEKYKDKGAETDGIIGHFGLGFYSAFMVADQVRIDTRSWQSDAQPASWQSQDGMAYEMGTSERVDRGTLITVTLSEEGKEFLNGEKVREILEKYCGFMPYPIYFNDVVADRERAERARRLGHESIHLRDAGRPGPHGGSARAVGGLAHAARGAGQRRAQGERLKPCIYIRGVRGCVLRRAADRRAGHRPGVAGHDHVLPGARRDVLRPRGVLAGQRGRARAHRGRLRAPRLLAGAVRGGRLRPGSLDAAVGDAGAHGSARLHRRRHLVL